MTEPSTLAHLDYPVKRYFVTVDDCSFKDAQFISKRISVLCTYATIRYYLKDGVPTLDAFLGFRGTRRPSFVRRALHLRMVITGYGRKDSSSTICLNQLHHDETITFGTIPITKYYRDHIPSRFFSSRARDVVPIGESYDGFIAYALFKPPT